MNMIDCKQIISSFVERYGFSVLYANTQMFMDIENSEALPNAKMAVEYLQGVSITGRKSIGFFERIPTINVGNVLRGECLLITGELPTNIVLPTIFCKQPSDLYAKLLLAGKVSQNVGMPVVVVISGNAVNNMCLHDFPALDTGRANSYISHAVVESVFHVDNYNKAIDNAYEILKNELTNDAISDQLSFYDTDSQFFEYLLPNIITPQLKSVANKKIATSQEEIGILEKYFASYYTKVTLEASVTVEKLDINDFLCPGCPFVSIFANSNINPSETLVFSNSACSGVRKYFGVTEMLLDKYAGIANSASSMKTLFIGNVSSYNKSLVDNIKSPVVFLNNTNVSSLDGFTTVKHPKKLTADKNTLFAYSCNNIKRFAVAKVKPKLCVDAMDEIRSIMDYTKCPAMYISGNILAIDNNLCTGCLACKTKCNSKAIVSSSLL